jgi:hypothetical protein
MRRRRRGRPSTSHRWRGWSATPATRRRRQRRRCALSGGAGRRHGALDAAPWPARVVGGAFDAAPWPGGRRPTLCPARVVGGAWRSGLLTWSAAPSDLACSRGGAAGRRPHVLAGDLPWLLPGSRGCSPATSRWGGFEVNCSGRPRGGAGDYRGRLVVGDGFFLAKRGD